jgi:hypothetical protein
MPLPFGFEPVLPEDGKKEAKRKRASGLRKFTQIWGAHYSPIKATPRKGRSSSLSRMKVLQRLLRLSIAMETV